MAAQKIWKTMGEQVWRSSSRLLEWAIPSLCYHCEIPVEPEMAFPLCQDCEDIAWKEPRCGRCGNRCHPSEVKEPRCYHCKDVALPQSSLESLGPYREWLRGAIIGAKYSEDPVCVRYLQGLIFQKWGEEKPAVITYVPSHRRRLKERKAKTQHLPMILGDKGPMSSPESLLERVHYTSAQVNLRGDERRKSKKNFFRYIGPTKAPEEVILFDDVWTTGATARQAAATLKEAGVKRVHIRVLAISAFEGRS